MTAQEVNNCEATSIMLRLNPNALVSSEGNYAVYIEDHWDCPTDRRMYRLEYRSTLDGRRAVAFCLHNPWKRTGESLGDLHVFADGCLCLGSDHARVPAQSPRNLENTVRRARYWCVAFSAYKETGNFPRP